MYITTVYLLQHKQPVRMKRFRWHTNAVRCYSFQWSSVVLRCRLGKYLLHSLLRRRTKIEKNIKKTKNGKSMLWKWNWFENRIAALYLTSGYLQTVVKGIIKIAAGAPADDRQVDFLFHVAGRISSCGKFTINKNQQKFAIRIIIRPVLGLHKLCDSIWKLPFDVLPQPETVNFLPS